MSSPVHRSILLLSAAVSMAGCSRAYQPAESTIYGIHAVEFGSNPVDIRVADWLPVADYVRADVNDVIVSHVHWDHAEFHANLEHDLANTLYRDPAGKVAAKERMKQLVAHPTWILPGHDREVSELFPEPGNGVARVR